ncbi:hypothetical protein [Eupransor demetentiae]|uniref:Uncharacterized protein n=1 Tax=Eupransor demetentiae TaxID=3109584 RepID=A0ABM9N4N7_9LACO|nr:hypothetical protein R54876_GBNLAHCA_00693 [Lactobacillaceae bacterium LMG 33000]
MEDLEARVDEFVRATEEYWLTVKYEFNKNFKKITKSGILMTDIYLGSGIGTATLSKYNNNHGLPNKRHVDLLFDYLLRTFWFEDTDMYKTCMKLKRLEKLIHQKAFMLNGNQASACRLMGIGRKTLHDWSGQRFPTRQTVYWMRENFNRNTNK